MSVTLKEGLNRLDVSLTLALCVLRGTVTDEAGKGIQYASVSCNGYSTTTDTEGYYSITKIPPGIYTVVFSKPLYESLTEVVTLTPEFATTLNASLTKSPAVTPTVRWIRAREYIVTVGERVFIDCQLVCYTPGTYSIECVIDGTTLIQDYTFSELNVGPIRTYEFTPTVAKFYTATVLGASVTFEVREAVIANLRCPYCEATHRCTIIPAAAWQTDTEEECLLKGGQWLPLSSEDLLVEHIAAFRHTLSGDPCSDWEQIYCPICNERFMAQQEFGWKSPRVKLAWMVVDHIKAVHPNEWEALHW